MNLDKLIKELKAPEPIKRMQAAEKLGKLNYPPVVDYLIDSVNDENPEVRYYVINALKRFKDKRVPAVIAQLLKDPIWYVRIKSGLILEDNLKKENKSSILEFLYKNDNNKLSKLYSAFAIITMNKDYDKKYADFILSLLKNNDINIRINAVSVLGSIKDYNCLDQLILLFNEQDDQVKEAIVYAMSNYTCEKVELWLYSLLKYKNHRIRSATVKVLGGYKKKSTVSKLITALNDENSYIRSEAAVALGNLGSKKAIQPLVKKLNDKDKNVVYYTKKALEKIGI